MTSFFSHFKSRKLSPRKVEESAKITKLISGRAKTCLPTRVTSLFFLILIRVLSVIYRSVDIILEHKKQRSSFCKKHACLLPKHQHLGN